MTFPGIQPNNLSTNDDERKHLILLFLFWSSIHIFLFLHYGTRALYDTIAYEQEADYLIKNGVFGDSYPLFYYLHVALIAIFRWVFPNQIFPFLLFQCLLSGAGTFCLYKASTKLFQLPLAGFLSCLLFLLWWDNIHWNSTAMTESLSCSFTLFLIYRLAHFKNSFSDYLWIAFLLLTSVFIRPTGVIALGGTLAFLLHYHWLSIRAKSVTIKCILFSCLGCLVIITAVQLSYHWDFSDQYARGNIITYADTIEGEALYNKSLRVLPKKLWLPEPDDAPMVKIVLFVINNPLYFFQLAFYKVAYLISFTRPYYSLAHNLYSSLWALLIYILYYIGRKQVHNKPVSTFTLTLIIANCGLVAISSVDWDNRFFIPMEPGIVLLAGGGMASLIEYFKKRHLISQNSI